MNWDAVTLPSATAFVVVTVAVFAVVAVIWRGDLRLQQRLQALTGTDRNRPRRRYPERSGLADYLRSRLPQFGGRLLAHDDTSRLKLQIQLLHAGIYSPSAPSVFAAAKLSAMVLPPAVATAAGFLEFVDATFALLAGGAVGLLGLVLPGQWLAWRTARRQTSLRRGLPDYIDLVVACLESGLSLEAALQRVTEEMRAAHPLLAAEMHVVQREIELGRTTDDALRNFAERSGLEVVRTLSTFVQQARRFGANITESLRIHADMLRDQREQRAEEKGQKAAVKILFPTLLCIFPAIFVVLVGPAAIQIRERFVDSSDGAAQSAVAAPAAESPPAASKKQ